MEALPFVNKKIHDFVEAGSSLSRSSGSGSKKRNFSGELFDELLLR